MLPSLYSISGYYAVKVEFYRNFVHYPIFKAHLFTCSIISSVGVTRGRRSNKTRSVFLLGLLREASPATKRSIRETVCINFKFKNDGYKKKKRKVLSVKDSSFLFFAHVLLIPNLFNCYFGTVNTSVQDIRSVFDKFFH